MCGIFARHCHLCSTFALDEEIAVLASDVDSVIVRSLEPAPRADPVSVAVLDPVPRMGIEFTVSRSELTFTAKSESIKFLKKL